MRAWIDSAAVCWRFLLIFVKLMSAANESARTGGGEETSGSREQERRQENGEVGKASGSGRVDNDGDGSSGAAVAGRPTGI